MTGSMIGAPPSGWRLVGLWEHSESVDTVEFLGLGGLGEIAVVATGVSLAATGYRLWEVSADGGDNWLSGTGVYTSLTNESAATDLTWGRGHFTDTADALDFCFTIVPFGASGGAKMFDGNLGPGIVAEDRALSALRVLGIGDDFTTPVNLTGGSIVVWGR